MRELTLKTNIMFYYIIVIPICINENKKHSLLNKDYHIIYTSGSGLYCAYRITVID